MRMASISSRFGYSCLSTTSKALNSRSFFGDKPKPSAAVSSKVLKMRPYRPYRSMISGRGVSHSRIAIRKGVFILRESKSMHCRSPLIKAGGDDFGSLTNSSLANFSSALHLLQILRLTSNAAWLLHHFPPLDLRCLGGASSLGTVKGRACHRNRGRVRGRAVGGGRGVFPRELRFCGV